MCELDGLAYAEHISQAHGGKLPGDSVEKGLCLGLSAVETLFIAHASIFGGLE